MLRLYIILLLGFSVFAFGQNYTAEQVLDKIDQNMSSKNRVIISKMIVHGQRADRTMQAKTWSVGTEKSFTEYLAPAREKGTKILKLEDHLWMYSPSTDRIVQISGHMLRQSMMGSDLSYEDMMDDESLRDSYNAVIVDSDTVDKRNCWILELTAKDKTVSYHMRKIWVDKERFVPLKEELYAKSGKLLKQLSMSDIVFIQNRWFPKQMVFKDMLKSGKGTEFIVEEIEFDVKIPTNRFSKALLRR